MAKIFFPILPYFQSFLFNLRKPSNRHPLHNKSYFKNFGRLWKLKIGKRKFRRWGSNPGHVCEPNCLGRPARKNPLKIWEIIFHPLITFLLFLAHNKNSHNLKSSYEPCFAKVRQELTIFCFSWKILIANEHPVKTHRVSWQETPTLLTFHIQICLCTKLIYYMSKINDSRPPRIQHLFACILATVLKTA